MNWFDRAVLKRILLGIMAKMEGNMGLKGYKTFICAAILVVAAGLNAFQLIDDKTYQVLLGVWGGAGLAALRLAK